MLGTGQIAQGRRFLIERTPAALGQISGLGWRGYLAALDALVAILRERERQ